MNDFENDLEKRKIHHDLNNALGSILGYADLLKNHLTENNYNDPKSFDYIEKIMTQVVHAININKRNT